MRYNWAKAFNIIWHGAKMVALAVPFVHCQTDEKWFYAKVIRTHVKHVPFFKCIPTPIPVKNKQHLGKVMCICVAAFIPNDNDFNNGGTAVKIFLGRAGGMVKAKNDTFKRVYFNDTENPKKKKYHYPKIPENRLLEKGREYFHNWEITGSK